MSLGISDYLAFACLFCSFLFNDQSCAVHMPKKWQLHEEATKGFLPHFLLILLQPLGLEINLALTICDAFLVQHLKPARRQLHLSGASRLTIRRCCSTQKERLASPKIWARESWLKGWHRRLLSRCVPLLQLMNPRVFGKFWESTWFPKSSPYVCRPHDKCKQM